MRTRIFLAILCTSLLGWVSPLWAVESFCPGGSSPRADILFCEDWETYNPVTNADFPDTEGSLFHGWEALSQGRSNGHGYIQSTLAHAGTYALRQVKEANGNFVPDIEHTLTSTPDVRVRVYLYFKSPYGNLGTTGVETGVHVMFLNTTQSNTGQRFDLEPYINVPIAYDPWPPTCVSGDANDNAYLAVDSQNARLKGVTLNRTDLCFDIVDHLNEWILVEWYYHATSSSAGTAGLWINGTQMMSGESLAPDSANWNTTSVILSGFWSPLVNVAAELYFDDLVVSNNSALTIGPTGGSDTMPPAAPTGVHISKVVR